MKGNTAPPRAETSDLQVSFIVYRLRLVYQPLKQASYEITSELPFMNISISPRI